jgi:hypothetical protein
MPGSAGAPGQLNIDGTYTPSTFATLMIQIASDDQFSVLTISETANLDGTLERMLLKGFIPAPGETFAFLVYNHRLEDSEFSRIANVNFDDMHWEITYENRMAFLTAVGGPVPGGVPDQGSTFLLLTLGLLSLVTCQRQLLRRHA